mgnify:FL=1
MNPLIIPQVSIPVVQSIAGQGKKKDVLEAQDDEVLLIEERDPAKIDSDPQDPALDPLLRAEADRVLGPVDRCRSLRDHALLSEGPRHPVLRVRPFSCPGQLWTVPLVSILAE